MLSKRPKAIYQQYDTLFDKWPLPEKVIIVLSQLFFIHGYHQLSTRNMYKVGSIMQSMLVAINYYHSPSFLAVETHNDSHRCIDLYKKGLACNAYTTVESITVFLEELTTDFLWIEESEMLMDLGWYAKFKKALQQSSYAYHMPIIIISSP